MEWTLPAEGLLASSWLLIALPLAGAAVLLLAAGAPTAGATCWATATVVAAFVLARARTPFELAGLEERSVDVDLFTFISAGDLDVGAGLLYDPLSAVFVLLITGVGSLIHIYSIGYMAHDPGAPPVLRLPEPVRRGDAAAGPRQQLRRALRRLGGRRSRVLPADRLLVHPPGRGHGGQEGVHHEPGRRRRPGPGDLPDVRPARDDVLRGRLRRGRHPRRRHGHRARAAAPARRVRQVRPVPAAGVAARRHGGPDPGLGPHPRRDHGHRRRLPDRPLRADLRPDARRRAPSSWRSAR